MTFDLPRYAYHGTTRSAAEEILSKGIRPRRMTQSKGHWDAHPSIDTHVYLSRLYAPYFAICATSSSENEQPTVLEIDLHALDPTRLMPDEDFIEQAHREWPDAWPADAPTPPYGSMQERMDFIRPRIHEYQFMWGSSALLLGNLAHKGTVPAEAITRAVVSTDQKAMQPITTDCMDPTITIANARYLGSKYEALSKWWVGDEIEATSLDPYGSQDLEAETKAWGAQMVAGIRQRRATMQRLLTDRPGMESLL